MRGLVGVCQPVYVSVPVVDGYPHAGSQNSCCSLSLSLPLSLFRPATLLCTLPYKPFYYHYHYHYHSRLCSFADTPPRLAVATTSRLPHSTQQSTLVDRPHPALRLQSSISLLAFRCLCLSQNAAVGTRLRCFISLTSPTPPVVSSSSTHPQSPPICYHYHCLHNALLPGPDARTRRDVLITPISRELYGNGRWASSAQRTTHHPLRPVLLCLDSSHL